MIKEIKAKVYPNDPVTFVAVSPRPQASPLAGQGVKEVRVL